MVYALNVPGVVLKADALVAAGGGAQHDESEARGGVGAVHHAAGPAGELLHELLSRAAGVVAAAGDGGGEGDVQHVLAGLGEGTPEVQELTGVYLAGPGHTAGAHEPVELLEALLGHAVHHRLAVHGEGHLVRQDAYLPALFEGEVAAGVGGYLVGVFTHSIKPFFK